MIRDAAENIDDALRLHMKKPLGVLLRRIRYGQADIELRDQARCALVPEGDRPIGEERFAKPANP
ncbi:hypothetical protein [Methylosinus sp. PW1]|uniref:hypothetical protein n=1 Tax=Methylosinus sp. PW1 TaxID=107636 RepID=UPI0012EB3F50|nr:hypothetical protein [Methylosinus sp. PW1]